MIYSKKLFIGPFYCLVDEFLTDKTCFEKNLEIGMKTAIDWGCTDFIGYLPDTFGHSANVLDILRDFGIDKCIVWRGCGDFPAEFKEYVEFIEQETGVPVKIISVGPDRAETIIR